jgi:hypothetical protein
LEWTGIPLREIRISRAHIFSQKFMRPDCGKAWECAQ